MKSSKPQRRSRILRAKASTLNPSEFEDYGPEPNMKLSHAFMVVLALHILAVAGLFAFNKMKIARSSLALKSAPEHLSEKASSPTTTSPQDSSIGSTHSPQVAPAEVSKTMASSTAAPSLASTEVPAPGAPSTPVTPPPTGSLPPSSPSSSSLPVVPAQEESTPASPALREYTIVKGDNPYKVAKKFHVSYDALMKLNNISDPRKIQIGQKLKIPAVSQHPKLKK